MQTDRRATTPLACRRNWLLLFHSANGNQVLHTVQALYPFSSGNDEELNFEKGEVMDVVEKPENDPEWWKCRKADGQIGLVPKNYVTVSAGVAQLSQHGRAAHT